MNSTNSDELITKSTSEIIESTYQNLIKGMTGLAIADKKELIFSISRVLKNIRASNLLVLLRKEWDFWQEKGKIKDDYTKSEQHLNCLQELLDFLDNDIPDETRFAALKKIFLVAASETISNREEILPQQFIRICKRLTSGEIVVLLTTYKLAKEKNFKYNPAISMHQWLELIANNSPLKYSELVEMHEKNLITLRLISGPAYSDGSGIQMSSQLRLTSLGIAICKYLEEYELIKP